MQDREDDVTRTATLAPTRTAIPAANYLARWSAATGAERDRMWHIIDVTIKKQFNTRCNTQESAKESMEVFGGTGGSGYDIRARCRVSTPSASRWVGCATVFEWLRTREVKSESRFDIANE